MPIERAKREKTCSNCQFWDGESPDHGEVLATQYTKNRRFLCRQAPVEVYKDSDDWCGQHQGK